MPEQEELITCPICNGKGGLPYTGTNPGTGNTFRATRTCDTCKGKGRIHQNEYPEHLMTAEQRTTTTDGKQITPWDTPTTMVEKYREDFALLLPSHINASQWVRLATGAVRKNKDLAAAAASSPSSLLGALSDAARLGLEPGTEEFYLVPFKNKGVPEVQGITGYQGVIELIYRAGAVSSVIAEVVYQNDIFRYQPGRDERPIHEIDWDADDRGPLRLAYAYAIMKDGATSKVVIANKATIERAKSASRGSDSKYSPWNTDEAAMWLKTAVRQLRKWVPTSAEYRREQIRAVHTVARETAAPPVDLETGEILDGELVGDDE